MNPNDLRDGYIRFFNERGHETVASDRLIPENDPSLLFTPAGMNQFKDMFMGVGSLPFKRATSSQKCLRMPDLDNVGRTASHHTFFEMLGNFSFGDYFKEDAIAWSIEYLVGTVGLDFKDLAVSVYEDDDEAASIWSGKLNVPADRLYRFGEKSNFWPAEAPSKGPNGVCGPCSEIHVDLGGGCGKPECDPECDCGRWVEVWNLVFTQFLRKDGGVLEPLPQKNIDTGLGFERLLRLVEGVPTNFDTTLFAPTIGTICELSGREYGADADDTVRIRRIADHIRAAVFCISEGITPSNLKQGYVVRKILRRAVLDGTKLGLEGLFLHKLVAPVVDSMGQPYPELVENRERIEREVHGEEDKFSATFTQGLTKLESYVHDLEKRGRNVLPGDQAFLLYDTFGFPLDITVRFLEERGGSVDVDGFNREMEAQRARARAGSNIATDIFDTGPLSKLKGTVQPTVFTGHDGSRETPCRIEAILTGEGLVDAVSQGDQATLVLDRTSFYAEAGGQTGDTGSVRSDTFTFAVNGNTVKEGDFHLHRGVVTEGSLNRGDAAVAVVSTPRRASIERNHTATHLLHQALRQVLGDHVEQAGSLVEAERLRFDFHHPRAVTMEEIEKVQARVNEKICADLPIETREMAIDEARGIGAMALFGEKYGDVVRTVTVRTPEGVDPSIELCGGTHVRRTGEIGGFAIVNEESIASGVRRIEAATASALDEFMNRQRALLREAAKKLKVPVAEVTRAIGDLQQQAKDLRKEIGKIREEKAGGRLEEIIGSGKDLGEGSFFYSGRVDGLNPPDLKKLIDKVRGRAGGAFGIVLLSRVDARANFVAAVDESLIKRGMLGANAICGELGKGTGGGGGGRPTMAQGQGKASDDLDTLLASVLEKALAGLDS